jgi:acyl-coenzyme A synthetase/AMP-(fatty) acid ligase
MASRGVAFVVACSRRNIDSVVIDVHCRNSMASFTRPRRLFVVDSLPKSATGKVQRYA